MNLSTREVPMSSDNEIIELARSVEAHDFDRIAPPPQVWNNILAEVEVQTASSEATARRQSQPRFSSTRLLTAAAALVILAGIAVAALSFRSADTPPVIELASPITGLATATLTDQDLPVSTTEIANATFGCDDDTCYIEVVLTGLPDAGADDLELWVINGDVTDMHTLGLVTAGSGRYELPPGVTPDDFPIVDISIEPDDGDATHSGQSVLRGILEDI